MSLRTPRADGLAVAPNAPAVGTNPAASSVELQAHNFWGRWATAAQLPNAPSNPAANPAYDLLRPGDRGWAAGLGYVLLDRGTLGGGDAAWALASAAGVRSTGVSQFTAAAFYEAPANSLPGSAAGFLISQVFRVIGPVDPAAQGAGLACYWLFAGDGGYHMSLAPNGAANAVRAVWGIGQDSDGQVIQNFGTGALDYDQPAGIGPWWRQYGRLYTMTMAFDGVDAVGYLNGEVAAVLGPAGGYRPPDATFRPMLGRNENPGAPTPLTGVELVGVGYRAPFVATEAQVIDHHLACLEDGTFADLPAGGFGSWWSFDGVSAAPAVLVDRGPGGVDFTLAAPGLVAATRRTEW